MTDETAEHTGMYEQGREFGRQHGRQYGKARAELKANQSDAWLEGYYAWEVLEGPCISCFTDHKGVKHYYEGDIFNHMSSSGPRVHEMKEVECPYEELHAPEVSWFGRIRRWFA